MQISFTLPDSAAAMLERLAQCISKHSQHAPSVSELARSMIIDLLADDAEQHGEIPAPPIVPWVQ